MLLGSPAHQTSVSLRPLMCLLSEIVCLVSCTGTMGLAARVSASCMKVTVIIKSVLPVDDST